MLAAVGKNVWALEYVCEELRADKEVELTAIIQDAIALNYATEELKNDSDIQLIYRLRRFETLTDEELNRARDIMLSLNQYDFFEKYIDKNSDNPEVRRYIKK